DRQRALRRDRDADYAHRSRRRPRRCSAGLRFQTLSERAFLSQKSDSRAAGPQLRRRQGAGREDPARAAAARRRAAQGALSARLAGTRSRFGLADVLAEELQGPLTRLLGRCGVIRAAVVAVEAVVG